MGGRREKHFSKWAQSPGTCKGPCIFFESFLSVPQQQETERLAAHLQPLASLAHKPAATPPVCPPIGPLLRACLQSWRPSISSQQGDLANTALSEGGQRPHRGSLPLVNISGTFSIYFLNYSISACKDAGCVCGRK